MIEILDDLGVLVRSDLDPETLSLAGVPFGADAADSVQRRQITEASSSIVHRSISGTDSAPEYFAADDRRLTLEEVIDSAIGDGGMVHFADKLSYKIVGSLVVGFALYGAGCGHLAHFGYLRSYEQFLLAFGTGDRTEESRVYGDLLGYHNYYWHSRKHVYWSAGDEDGTGCLSSISLGDYPGNAGPE
ncbi:hypothetical protein [Micromonospora sp. NPDC049204]|uniref:hypothetical protein n=1 Tax=Micromonospora sp. NPDC049204 TaxID=3154351 RepID=UPI0033E8AB32